MMRILTILFSLMAAVAAAQTPQTQPLLQQSNLVYLGSFTTPTTDGSGGTFPQGSLTYGGVAGLGPNGTTLYYGLHNQANTVGEITIPPIGGVASIVVPGRWMPMNATFDSPASAAYVGAAINWNGRILVTGYVGYDNNPVAAYSWFTFDAANFTTATRLGPFSMNPTGGLTGQYCGLIPTEWRPLLGGPVACGASSLSIITRSSRGPVFAVFNPDSIGPTTTPAQMLVHYAPPQTLTVPEYNEADQYGGFAFPAGSRTVLYVRRHGDNANYCYGTGAQCGDPIHGSQGSHAYPYRHEVLAYDANDLLAVKQGTKLPYQVLPYATWTLTEMAATGAATMKSSVFDPATGRWYISAFSGSGTPRVHVYQVTVPQAQPVDATYGPWSDWLPIGEWSACSPQGTRTRAIRRTREELTPAQNGGATQPTSEDSEETGTCAFDATYTEWSAWTILGTVAGVTVEERTRSLVLPAVNGGATGVTWEARVTIGR